MNSLFIFGLGYTSQEIAKLAIERGYKVYGTCRTAKKCELLRQQNIKAFLFDEVPRRILENATHILSSVPPQEGQGDIVIPKLPNTTKWYGYLSTTGVYGDYGGQWVSEQSECRPSNDRLKRRIIAEKEWKNLSGHVFRLAGIYGTGRNAIDDVKAGIARRIDKKGQVFSRIHVADIAQTILASMNNPNPSSIYNVCDDEPAPAFEVVEYACKLLGITPPPLIAFEQAELSAMGREFYSANRRVKNDKIKQELGIILQYPSYREGLMAIL